MRSDKYEANGNTCKRVVSQGYFEILRGSEVIPEGSAMGGLIIVTDGEYLRNNVHGRRSDSHSTIPFTLGIQVASGRVAC